MENHTIMSESTNKYQDSPSMYSYVDNTATCENQILVVAYQGGADTTNWSATYNGAALTVLSGHFGSGISNDSLYIAYLLNPDWGNFQLRINTDWRTGAWTATIFCGVDQTAPILASSTPAAFYTTNTFNLSGLSAGDAMISYLSRAQYCDNNTQSWDAGSTPLAESCWGGNVSGAYLIATSSVADMTVMAQPTYYEGFALALKATAPPAPDGLTIAINDFDAITQQLHLYGLCDQQGSGINQMRIIGLADNATTSQPVLPDPLGVARGTLVDCDGNYNAYYDGYGLLGTHTIAIDDTFFGTQWVTWTQDFNASSTPEWTFSYGYMSQDDPTGTASRLACSDAEWATPDPVIGIDWLSATTSVPAFNFTKIKCNIVKQYYVSLFSLRDQAKLAGVNAGEALGNMFPFNFSTVLKNAWAQSASSTMPTGLEFLNTEKIIN